MSRLSAEERLARFGPSTGDRVRLGDTDLWIRVAEDRQAPGDEPQWGYARNLRPGLAQAERPTDSQLDVLIAGVLVVDPVIGVVKADIGIKDGRIVGVGRAGNPAITDGVDLPVGPLTMTFMGYGYIATPGAIDSHVHTIGPALVPAALSGGVTTLIGAGFVEPPWAMERVLGALEGWPVNVGLQANARSLDDGPLDALIDAGAVGFKIHEDYGAYPEIIDHTLRYADDHDVSVSLHTDGLHETAELEDTVAAIAGRTVHAYHVEGAGGGHVPGPARARPRGERHLLVDHADHPVRRRAPAEHVPMTDPQPRGVVRPARGRGARPGADPSRDDGRRGPAPRARGDRHRQLGLAGHGPDRRDGAPDRPAGARPQGLAGDRSGQRASRPPPETGDPHDDTDRVLRYLAKVTIEPAITHGLADHVGSLQPGRLADIVLWKPAYFGAKPEWIFKGGYPAWGPLGDGNASVERSEPTRYQADWGAEATAAPDLAVTFVVGRHGPAVACEASRDATRAPARHGLPRPDPGIARPEPGHGADRDRPGGRPGHPGGPAARDRAGHDPAAQPAVLPALITRCRRR